MNKICDQREDLAEAGGFERMRGLKPDRDAVLAALGWTPEPTPPGGDAWDRILADPALAAFRRKVSMHEIRLVITHVRADDEAKRSMR